MKDPIVIIGIGEIGGVFARGFLRCGHPVYPIVRSMDMSAEAKRVPEPALVLLAVAEKDLHDSLARVPAPWCERLGLLQNELLPRDWERHRIPEPTVVSVWFEKKKGQDAKVLVPSPVYGPHAGLLEAALRAVDIPGAILRNEDELLFELVRKNLYILTTNIAGLVVGGTVDTLWREHESLAREVFADALALQERLTGRRFDPASLLEAVLAGFAGDPAHKCMGRSAPARLERALHLADEAGLAVPALRRIAATQAATA